jgi:hypothetical protein
MRMARHSILGAGKTQNWAGATPLLTAFSRPKTSWGRSSPVFRRRVRYRAFCPRQAHFKGRGPVTQWEE